MTPKQIIKAHFSKLGKKGGKATSQVKAEAARANGKKGGRPKTVKVVNESGGRIEHIANATLFGGRPKRGAKRTGRPKGKSK